MKLTHILLQLLLEKKEDRCKRIADRRYDKPSAYKSGAIVRCRQGKIWKDLKEDESFNITENYSQDTIEQVFLAHPELAAIGTPGQYSQYLSTIFPDSVVKMILHHRSPNKIDKFDKSRISQTNARKFYFSPFNTSRYGSNLYYVILNIKNLAKPQDKEWLDAYISNHPEYVEGRNKWFSPSVEMYVNSDKYGFDGVFAYEGTNDDEYSVYEPEQIHILGSQEDIEGFKKFVGEKITEAKKETLRTWFKRKGAPGKEGGWVDCNTCRNGKCKPCGRKEGEKRAKYPSCRPTPAGCKKKGKGKTWGKTK